MLVQGIGAYSGMRSMDRVTTGLAEDVLPSVTLVGETRALLGEYRTASYRGLVRASDAAKREARERAVQIDAQLAENLKAYERFATTADEQRLLAELVAAWEAARVSYASVNEMLDLELPDDATDTFIGEIYGLAGLENVADAADPNGELGGYPLSFRLWGILTGKLAAGMDGHELPPCKLVSD